MTYVERIHPGFQWAEPLRKQRELDVEKVGDELIVSGFFPSYEVDGPPADLIRQYETVRKNRSKKKTGKDAPHVRFANADTEKELIDFVRTFGPVVAKSAKLNFEPPLHLTARQDLKELKSEQLVYRAALSLIMEIPKPQFDYDAAQGSIREIAVGIQDWSRQWQRERTERKVEPSWKLTEASLKRIQSLSSGRPDILLPPNIDSRIVICELLNVFRSMAFPNPMELHSSIRWGIRPLLYSILRREFLNPRDTGVCANNQCRDFFEIERAGQQFCTPECSRQQRQRDYWAKRGKKLRTNRVKKRAK